MEAMIAAQSGTLLRALRVMLNKRVLAYRGGDHCEVPQPIQTKNRLSPRNYVTPFAHKPLPEHGFGL